MTAAALAREKFTRLGFWVCVLTALVLALMPVLPPQMPTTGWDKSNHLITFAILGLLGRAAYRQRILMVFLGLFAYGGLIEVLQSFTPQRLAEWGDWLADGVGLAVAFAAGWALDWRPLQRSARPMLALPRTAKRVVALGVDACLCVFTVWLALSLRLEGWVTLSGAYWWAVAGALVLALPVFVVFGLYRAIFRYGGGAALTAVWHASVIYGVLYGVAFTVVGVDGVPRTVGMIQPPLLLVAVGAARALARFWLGGSYRSLISRSTLPKVLVYGAGSAGQQLSAALSHNPEMQVIGFLDDDRRLHGGMIRGLPIYSPTVLENRVRSLEVSMVLLAIPSAPRKRRNEILDSLLKVHVAVRTLPGLMDLAHGRVQTSDLRDLEIEDLLGRDAVPPNQILLGKNICGKVVLVTGAGGSIGSELCRQIVRAMPHTLLLVERSEYALYALHGELLHQLAGEDGQEVPAMRVVPLLASVRDEQRMREIMAAWRPDTVYHAAAYKHVPLVEHNAAEGVKNNVLGTLVTARVAADHGVRDFVLVSTDKAVRPTNVMGTSKRLAEMVLQALAEEAATKPGGTRFCMVRFGNVLGSSGSVVPLFRQQIKQGGPITLTHADVTRYFMTIPEAAQLVIQAGAMASGGDVFVLDMGEPVKIIDLARRMVELSGRTVCDAANPEGDIEIRVTGMRPGEKLYEELLIGDNPLPTHHPRIMKAHEDFLPWDELALRLQALTDALDSNDVPAIRELLQQVVLGYRPEGELVDWVHLEQRVEAVA
ncbi:VanZ family protein [Variovorax sp. J22P240]|uniref:VanZ family protein n=1 Tax=Variovorax sp. J22P240 TaxID=3053514 RepID=UPI002578097F|nr:VanZ family protein [Variovorax sp. J22P240]MDL9998085.1 VanZ family protein [Variovorax sp. J22P240]